MPSIPYGDWVTALLTIAYFQLLTLKKWYAWPIGLLTQIIWIYLSIGLELYGITTLSVVILFQCAYGWWRWSKIPNVSQ